VQSAAGRVSCNRIALNRCTETEARWNRNPVSLDSPVLTEILLPISFKRRQAEELKTTDDAYEPETALAASMISAVGELLTSTPS